MLKAGPITSVLSLSLANQMVCLAGIHMWRVGAGWEGIFLDWLEHWWQLRMGFELRKELIHQRIFIWNIKEIIDYNTAFNN